MRVYVVPFVMLSLTLPGCARRESDIRPPDPNPQPQLITDVDARVQTLKELVRVFSEHAKKLPDADESQHRGLMEQTFAQLEEILPLLEGPEPSSEFRQQMMVLTHARSQISDGSTTLAADPAIDAGLRAAQRALAIIHQRLFFDEPRVADAMKQFDASIVELDKQGGALHSLAVSRAVDNLAKVLDNMAAVFEQRLNDERPEPDPAGAVSQIRTKNFRWPGLLFVS